MILNKHTHTCGAHILNVGNFSSVPLNPKTWKTHKWHVTYHPSILLSCWCERSEKQIFYWCEGFFLYVGWSPLTQYCQVQQTIACKHSNFCLWTFHLLFTFCLTESTNLFSKSLPTGFRHEYWTIFKQLSSLCEICIFMINNSPVGCENLHFLIGTHAHTLPRFSEMSIKDDNTLSYFLTLLTNVVPQWFPTHA